MANGMIEIFNSINDYCAWFNSLHQGCKKRRVKPIENYFTVDELVFLLYIHNSISQRIIAYGYKIIPEFNRSRSEFENARFSAGINSYFYKLTQSYIEASIIVLFSSRIMKINNHGKYNPEKHSHYENKFKELMKSCGHPWFTIPFGYFFLPGKPKEDIMKIKDKNQLLLFY